MADSNEIVTNQKHARLRPPQAGINAQVQHDEGEPLTSSSYANRMNDLMLDLMNGRVEREQALAVVQVGNSILKAAALELKNRELHYTYANKHEQNLQSPEPLRLATGRKTNPIVLTTKEPE